MITACRVSRLPNRKLRNTSHNNHGATSISSYNGTADLRTSALQFISSADKPVTIDFNHEKFSLCQLENIVQSAQDVHLIIHARGRSSISAIRYVLNHFIDSDRLISSLNRVHGSPEKQKRSGRLRGFPHVSSFQNIRCHGVRFISPSNKEVKIPRF